MVRTRILALLVAAALVVGLMIAVRIFQTASDLFLSDLSTVLLIVVFPPLAMLVTVILASVCLEGGQSETDHGDLEYLIHLKRYDLLRTRARRIRCRPRTTKTPRPMDEFLSPT